MAENIAAFSLTDKAGELHGGVVFTVMSVGHDGTRGTSLYWVNEAGQYAIEVDPALYGNSWQEQEMEDSLLKALPPKRLWEIHLADTQANEQQSIASGL